jgi:hypothetical protein
MTCAPTSLHPKAESLVIATPNATVFLGSVERRCSAPAIAFEAVVRGLGEGWSKASGAAIAQLAVEA